MSGLFNAQILRPIAPRDDKWLEPSFVSSYAFSMLLNATSTIISVPDGGGKTTLTAMAQRVMRKSWLCVEVKGDIQEQPNDDHWLDPLMREATQQLWRYVQANPSCLIGIGTRATVLKYCFMRYLGSELTAFYLERLMEDHADVSSIVKTLLAIVSIELFATSTPDWQRLDVLADCATKLGLNGVIFWFELHAGSTAASLVLKFASRFFYSHPFLSNGSMHFKCLAPAVTFSELAQLGGGERSSVDLLQVSWDEPSLIELLDRRVQVASDGQLNSLAQLVDINSFCEFANAVLPSKTPREWLGLAQFIGQKMGDAGQIPLTDNAWDAARHAYYEAHIPLTLDASGTFKRGSTEVITPRQKVLHRLLSHLYDNPEPQLAYALQQDKALNLDATSLNTYMHRLRAAVEPFPKQGHIYLVTDQSRGTYTLRHTDKSP